MRKLVRAYVYKEDYDFVIAIAKANYLRNAKCGYSFAKGLEFLLKKQEEKIASQEISKLKNTLENEISASKIEMERIRNKEKLTEERMKRIQANKEQKIKELENIINRTVHEI